LTILNLKKNNFNTDGAIILLKSIEENRSLVSLNLSNNKLTD